MADGTDSTILLFNETATPENFTVRVASGQIVWTKKYALAPLATKAIDINELIQDQAKDDEGNVLPSGLQAGDANWFETRQFGGAGRLLQSNPAEYAARGFSCGMYAVISGADWYPEVSSEAVGQTNDLGELDARVSLTTWTGSCGGNYVGDSNDYEYGWNSGNTSIATVSGGGPGYDNTDFTGVAAGNATINGFVWDQYGCQGGTDQQVTVTGDQTPVLTGIDPDVWNSSASAPTTTPNVTFTGQYFGTNPPTLSFSPSTGISYTLSSYGDTQIVANITVAAGTPNEDVEVSVTNNGYGGLGFNSAGSGAPATSSQVFAHVQAPMNSPEVTVIAWINGQAPDIVATIGAGPTTSALRSDLTGGAASCLLQLAAWFAQGDLNLNTAQDIAYANAWMFQNAANTAPPTTLTTPASTSQLTGGFKLFNDFGGTGGGNTAQLGKSPYPCPGSAPSWFSFTGQSNYYNGYSDTSPSGMTYQINEGRMALPAQNIFAEINGHSVPWIWSVIEFDSSGNPFNVNQSFPTYYVYLNGTISTGRSTTQGPLANFTALSANTSQETPSQIP